MRNPPPVHGVSSYPGDRRSAPRYKANGAAVAIGWRDGDVTRTARASLEDISMGGASALADSAPPLGAAALVRVPPGVFGEPVRATVLGVEGARRFSLFRRTPREYLVRVSFDRGCPYEVFKAAVAGFVVETEAPGEVFECEGFDPRDWR